jgi:hypothetical protein
MKLWRVFWEAEHQVFERGTVEAPTAIEALRQWSGFSSRTSWQNKDSPRVERPGAGLHDSVQTEESV